MNRFLVIFFIFIRLNLFKCSNNTFEHSIQQPPTTIKSIFAERFPNISELYSDDVASNEGELEIILSYPFVSDPVVLYNTLKEDFLVRKLFKTITPQLVSYFDRYNNEISITGPELSKIQASSDMHKIAMESIRRHNFEFLFNSGVVKLSDYADLIFFESLETLKQFQLFIYFNQNYMKNVREFFETTTDDNYILIWIKYGLLSNMPDLFFLDYALQLKNVIKSKGFWTECSIPREIYSDLFDRINLIIEKLFRDGPEKDYYFLVNMVRFGVESFEIYHSQITSKKYSESKLALLCHCASLANKMDLFQILFDNCKGVLVDKIIKLLLSENSLELRRIKTEEFKILFHAYLFLSSTEREVFNRLPRFYKIVSKLFSIVGTYWSVENKEIEIRMIASDEFLQVGFLYDLSIHLKMNSEQKLLNFIGFIRKEMKFSNAVASESFYTEYSRTFSR